MRIGLIGAGEIGRLRAKSVTRRRDAALVAVADPNQDQARRAADGTGATVVADGRLILDRNDIDAVIVSTPVHLHEEAVLAALDGGKHVLCEKPLANNVDACRRMVAAAHARQRTLAVGFNHRFYPSMKFLKQVVDDGTIGTIDHLRVFGGHDGLQNFRAEWMYKAPVSGGGAMMDVGIHMTDLARYIAGEIVEVYGITRDRIWQVKGSEDNAAAIMQTAAGPPVFYEATWTEWKGYHWYVDAYGDRGMVRAYYAPMFNLLVTHDKPGGRRTRRYKLYPEIILREKLKGWQSTTLASFDDELSEFMKMIAGQRAAVADGWAGLRAVEIAGAVYQSAASGTPVRLSDAP